MHKSVHVVPFWFHRPVRFISVNSYYPIWNASERTNYRCTDFRKRFARWKYARGPPISSQVTNDTYGISGSISSGLCFDFQVYIYIYILFRVNRKRNPNAYRSRRPSTLQSVYRQTLDVVTSSRVRIKKRGRECVKKRACASVRDRMRNDTRVTRSRPYGGRYNNSDARAVLIFFQIAPLGRNDRDAFFTQPKRTGEFPPTSVRRLEFDSWPIRRPPRSS